MEGVVVHGNRLTSGYTWMGLQASTKAFRASLVPSRSPSFTSSADISFKVASAFVRSSLNVELSLSIDSKLGDSDTNDRGYTPRRFY